MGKHLLTIHDHKVFCEDDRAYHGVKYLAYTLSEDDCRTLFQQVESQREVAFADEEGRKFTLVDGENGSFTVVATNVSHGWL